MRTKFMGPSYPARLPAPLIAINGLENARFVRSPDEVTETSGAEPFRGVGPLPATDPTRPGFPTPAPDARTPA